MSKSAFGVKYVFALLLVVLALLLAYETWRIGVAVFLPKPPMTMWGNLEMYQWTAVGVVVYLVLRAFIINCSNARDFTMLWGVVRIRLSWFSKNLKWFEVFTHELTHTVVSLLLFRKMSDFQAGERSGVTWTSGGKLSGVFVTLAPYCLPIYSYFLLMLRPIVSTEGLWIYDILLGITLAFHFVLFATGTRNYQTDINQHPLLFSYSFIAVALLFNINSILVSFWSSKNIYTAWWYCLTEIVHF